VVEAGTLMAQAIIVINAGSSSIKFVQYQVGDLRFIARGPVASITALEISTTRVEVSIEGDTQF
jgi:acetate kinase